MSELLEFAARLIELEGGAIEPRPDGIHALLPSTLCAAWNAPEELALSEVAEGAERFCYGSELLERMIQTATHSLPASCVRLETSAPRFTQVRGAAERWGLRNGVVDVGEVRLSPQTRVWVDALATLHGDEKRELLVSAAISLHSGTQVEGFVDVAAHVVPATAATFQQVPSSALDAALGVCVRKAEEGAGSFRAAMTRRFERDRERIEQYFEDLTRELEKRVDKGRLDRAAIADKRQAMLRDRAAKLDALAARFVLRIDVLPLALRLVEVEGAFVALSLRRRKASRTIELEYDAATRRLVPPSCDACGASAPRPAACDDAVHLLCEACAPRAEGRIACPPCKHGIGVKPAISAHV